jgi:hypothetical protein
VHNQIPTILPWWEVDLGDEYSIDEISIWNRTDGCPERLTDFTVSVMNAGYTEVWSEDYFTDGVNYPEPTLSIYSFDTSAAITGRYVRIQLNSLNSLFLHMAEVEVYMVPEPTSLLLLTAGGGILLRKKLRRTKR